MEGVRVDLSDLTHAIGDSTKFRDLKHALESGEYAKQTGRASTLAAPLPASLQSKINRKAAYGESVQSVSKWAPFVAQNRKSPHINFKKQLDNVAPTPTSSMAALESTFVPKTDMEQKIDCILKASGIYAEDGISKLESLQMATKFTPEQIREKQAELAKLRSMAFFHEKKARRVAKIKSKTFRKIKRHQEAKELLKEGSGAFAAGLQEADVQEERILAELERARQRLTLKSKRKSAYLKDLAASMTHSTHDSLEFADNDEDDEAARAPSDSYFDLVQQVAAEESLKKKMLGIEEGEEESVDAATGSENIVQPDTMFKKLLLRTPKNSTAFLDSIDDDAGYFEQTENQPVSDPASKPQPAQDTFTTRSSGRMTFVAAATAADIAGMRPALPDADELGSKIVPSDAACQNVRLPSAVSLASQKDLVKRAFAADDVVQEFVDTKQVAIEEEIGSVLEKPVFLPGWGLWAGASQRESRSAQANKRNIANSYEQKKQSLAAARKDAGLAHVIISQTDTVCKKAASLYMTPSLPHPFTSMEAYEKSIAASASQRTQSFGAFRSGVKPRIDVKAGSVVLPPKLPSGEGQAATRKANKSSFISQLARDPLNCV